MKGFTLIELLIALAVSAVLATGTYYLVQATVGTRETLVAQNDYFSKLTRVMRTVENDLLQWSPNRPVRDAFGTLHPALQVDFDGFRLTRNGWQLSRFTDLERSDLQRVQYRLAEPGSELCPPGQANEAGGCLIRSHRLHLDDDGRLEWRHQVLMRSVRAINWRFLVTHNGQREYRDLWPPDDVFPGTEPPELLAVEFRLQTTDGDELHRLIAVARLPAGLTGGDDEP
ncbi:MAG: type II secretion system protein GspJ [Saccharospirillum sp.]